MEIRTKQMRQSRPHPTLGTELTSLFYKKLPKSFSKLWLAIFSMMIIGGTILMPVQAGAVEEIKELPATFQDGFIENQGQWPDEVLYMTNTKSFRAWITKKGMVFEQFEAKDNDILGGLDQRSKRENSYKAHAVGLEFVNSNSILNIQKGNQLKMRYNFLKTNDFGKHRSNVVQYEIVEMRNLYNGIDIKYYLDEGELRYDFIVHPNANPENIEFEIKGSNAINVIDGEIKIETTLQPIYQKDLYVYQFSESSIDSKQKVSAFFTKIGNRIKISLGQYDKTKPLIMDPLTLIKTHKINSTPLYGSPYFSDLTINQDGDIIFYGHTDDVNFPKTYGSFMGWDDIYVGKFITSSESFDWITIIGGDFFDISYSLVIDNNYIYLTGKTNSTDYPITANAFMINYPTNFLSTSFFTALSNNGTAIEYSTFIGNEFNEESSSNIKVSQNGDVYIVGNTTNNQNPSFYEYRQLASQQRGTGDYQLGFIMCFTPISSLNYNIKFSTLWGGDHNTSISGMDLDNDVIYISGYTLSSTSSFAITNDAYDEINVFGNPTAYVAKISFDNNEILVDYNTFFGSIAAQDEYYSMRPIIYRNNKIIFAGNVRNSGTIPLVNAFDNTRGNGTEAYIAVIQPFSDGINDLIYSSYVGDVANTQDVSIIHSLDYDINCQTIIFAGRTNVELNGYTGQLNEPFTPNYTNGILGTVDINLFTVQTLEELIYSCDNHDIFTSVKHNPSTNKLYVSCNGNDFKTPSIKEFTKKDCYDEGDCPCPSSSKEWLTVTVEKGGEGCDSDECLVTHRLAIPEEYSCFGYVNVSALIEGEVVSQPTNYDLSTFNMSDFNLCIKEGTNYTITVKLFKTCCDYNPCIIKKTVYCDVIEEAPPCTPEADCEHIGWTKRDKLRVQVLDCPGCYINVSYYTREACGFQDIQITKIEIEQTYMNICCHIMNASQAYLEAVKGVIHENVMGFFPRNSEQPCSDTWRVSNASCWATWFEYVEIGNPLYPTLKPINIRKPCFSNCCTRRLRVCRESESKTTIEDLGPGTPPFNCDGITYPAPTQTLQCEYLCASLENIDVIIGKSGKLDDAMLEEEPLYHKPYEQSKKAQFNISNNNEILRVLVDNSNASTLIINIFDINGKLLFSESNNIKSGLNAFDVDITSFNNGVYLYNITIDDFMVQTDKFMISR